MKNSFQLKNFLADNREVVIAKFEKLQKDDFYNGITLRNFMLEVFKSMENNNIKSEARANKMLPNILGQVVVDNKSTQKVYTTPYSQSNHAKMVNYYGQKTTNQLQNI